MGYIHLFAIKSDDVNHVQDILTSQMASQGYTKSNLTTTQMKWLSHHVKGHGWRVTIGGADYPKTENSADWLVYSIEKNPNGYIYIVPLYDRMMIDLYFGEIAAMLSRLLLQDVFYVWHDHASFGNEAYNSGVRTKSVINFTHNPDVQIDGEKVALKEEKKYGIVTHSFDHIINMTAFFPADLLDYKHVFGLSKKYSNLNPENKNHIFHKDNISNIDEYIKNSAYKKSGLIRQFISFLSAVTARRSPGKQ